MIIKNSRNVSSKGKTLIVKSKDANNTKSNKLRSVDSEGPTNNIKRLNNIKT